MKPKTESNPLWTWDFTVITLGSAVSMLGSVLASFAVSIMVLDYTGSTFLYALFNVIYQVPYLVMPLFAGPYLDRVSRKKAIYCLDFLTAGLYLAFYLLLRQDVMNYPLMLVGCFLNGAIGSIYGVAYESLYPNLITEGNYSKAYSVSSIISDLTGLAYPLGAVLYELIGTAPLFLLTAIGFFIAACFETQVHYHETHIKTTLPAESENRGHFRQDFREGIAYILSEKGLLLIAAYFTVSSLVSGGEQLILPFFRSHAELYAHWPVAAATLYAIVANFGSAGRIAGGLLHYRIEIPAGKKFSIAMTVYLILNLFDCVTLWLPIPLMALVFFLQGILGVTSYNIRIAATQSYVPDEKRARFNGTFQMITSVGGIVGSLGFGALAEIIPTRMILILCGLLGLGSAYTLIYRGRSHVAEIYNREL